MKKVITVLISLLLMVSLATPSFAAPEIIETIIFQDEESSESIESEEIIEVIEIEEESEEETTEASIEEITEEEIIEEIEETVEDIPEELIEIEEVTEEVIEAAPETVSETALLEYSDYDIEINPLYVDIVSESDIADETSVMSLDDEVNELLMGNSTLSDYYSMDECAVYLRSQLVARSTDIRFTIYVEAEPENSDAAKSLSVNTSRQLVTLAMTETGRSTEGDYLRWQYKGYSRAYSVSVVNPDDPNETMDHGSYISYIIRFTYYTSASQESLVTATLNGLYQSLGLASKSDLDKICTIYDYICSHVVYDRVHTDTVASGNYYYLKHTCYAALIDNLAVCQGYALLFYRMALDNGLKARLVAGTGNGGAHGWNIVELDNIYYYLDPTWDAGKSSYIYFLKGKSDFETTHVVNADQTTSFNYNISSGDSSSVFSHPLARNGANVETCTQSGNTEYYTCAACGKHYSDPEGHNIIQNNSWVIPAPGHSLSKHDEIPLTCTEDGNSEYYSCSVCGKYFSDEACENEIEENSWVREAKGHNISKTEAKEASCTEAGNSEYYSCSVCGKHFLDEACTREVTAESLVIQAKGHTEVIDSSVAATCSKTGKTEGSHCSVCNKVFTKQTVIDALKHNYVDGECTRCGSSYPTQIAEKLQDIPNGEKIDIDVIDNPNEERPVVNITESIKNFVPTELISDNVAEDVGITEADQEEGAYVWLDVSRAADAADAEYDITVEEEDYTVALELDISLYTMTTSGTVTTVSETESPVEVKITLPDDIVKTAENVKRTYKVKRVHGDEVTGYEVTILPAEYDSVTQSLKFLTDRFGEYSVLYQDEEEENVDEQHIAVRHIKVDATCTEDGIEEYYECPHCNKIFSDAACTQEVDEKDLVIEAEGHNLSKTEAIEETCTEAGNSEYYTCSVCGKYFSDASGNEGIEKDSWVIKVKDHTPETDAAVAATCTKTGLTEGEHCSVCKLVIKSQTTVAALGHNLSKTEATEATREKEGNSEYYTCSACGRFFSDEKGKKEIEQDSWVIEKIEIPAATSITLDKTIAEGGIKKTMQLKASVSPATADQQVTWTSSNKDLATVDANGLVKFGASRGVVTITATTADGMLSASCKITIQFNDILSLSNGFKNAINWLADKGIIKGYDNGAFGQEDTCTRKQFAIMLYRLAGKPAVSGTMPFSDCQGYKGDSYKAILWASQQGIVNGYKDGTFGPDNKVTRKQVLIMLYRYAGKPAVSGTMPFTDVDAGKNSDTYKAILWGSQKGITSGTSKTTFSPDDGCLRRQIAMFFYRFAK